MDRKEQLKELVGKAVLKGYCCGVNDGYMLLLISKFHNKLDKILEETDE